MIITISEGSNDNYIVLSSNDARFKNEWGTQIECRVNGMYKNLTLITDWANNNYHEACLFEVG